MCLFGKSRTVMINVFINGNATVIQKREIYKDFVDSRLYNAIKGELLANPRDEIKEWLESNYNFKNEEDYGFVMDYIACKL